MPHKDPLKAKEASKERMRRHRGASNVTPSQENVTPAKAKISKKVTSPTGPEQTPDVVFRQDGKKIYTGTLRPEWAHIREFISRPGLSYNGMTNLERLQSIFKSLGRFSDDVYFGGLTIGDIGKVIG